MHLKCCTMHSNKEYPIGSKIPKGVEKLYFLAEWPKRKQRKTGARDLVSCAMVLASIRLTWWANFQDLFCLIVFKGNGHYWTSLVLKSDSCRRIFSCPGWLMLSWPPIPRETSRYPFSKTLCTSLFVTVRWACWWKPMRRIVTPQDNAILTQPAPPTASKSTTRKEKNK